MAALDFSFLVDVQEAPVEAQQHHTFFHPVHYAVKTLFAFAQGGLGQFKRADIHQDDQVNIGAIAVDQGGADQGGFVAAVFAVDNDIPRLKITPALNGFFQRGLPVLGDKLPVERVWVGA